MALMRRLLRWAARGLPSRNVNVSTTIETDVWRFAPVMFTCNMTPMVKTQVYLGPEELEALHRVAAQSERSIADLIREAIRRVWLRPAREGPVGLWNGEPKRTSVDHDTTSRDA